MANNITKTFRRASWGCYCVDGLINNRVALCRDFEGCFEKPLDEINRDEIVTIDEYLAAENRRADIRFDSSMRNWENDLRRRL